MTIDRFRGEHQFLSNFYVHPLVVGGFNYHSVEQYFQSRKCRDRDDWDAVMATHYPAQAKKVGRAVRLRKDWEAKKLVVMRKALAHKFTNDNQLGERLVATGVHLLVEGNHWGDTFWGVDDERGGQNWLGYLLMARRGELRGARILPVTGPEVQRR